MAQPVAKRQKLSLKVKRSSVNSDLQIEQTSQQDVMDTHQMDVVSTNHDPPYLAINQSTKSHPGDNRQPDISDSLAALRKTISQFMPGILGIQASDWRSMPPLPADDIMQQQHTSQHVVQEGGTSSLVWSALPPVCMPCALRTRYKHSPVNDLELEHVDESSAPSASDTVLGHVKTHSAKPNSAVAHASLHLNIVPPETNAVMNKPSRLKPLFRKLKLKTSSRDTVSTVPPRDVAELTSTCKQRKSCHEQFESTLKSEEGSNLVERETLQPKSLFGNAKVNVQAIGSDGSIESSESVIAPLSKISNTKPMIAKLELQDESHFTVTSSEKCGKRSLDIRKPLVKVEVQACSSGAISAGDYNQKPLVGGVQSEAGTLVEPCSQRKEMSVTDLDQASTSKPQQKRLRMEVKRRNISNDCGSEFGRIEVKPVDISKKTEKDDQPQPISDLLATCPLCQEQFDEKYSQGDIESHVATCFATSEETQQKNQNSKPLLACPICKMQFDKRYSQVAIDGHIAVCYSNEEQAKKKGNEQKTTLVSTCSFCRKQFDVGLSQIDIDSHIAACMATLDEESDQDEQGDLSNTPTFTCPHCQITFGKGYSQVDIDGHFAACYANEAESSSKKQKTTRVSTCPLCQMKFDKRYSQGDIENHVAACFGTSEETQQENQNPKPLFTCPICKMQFDKRFSQVAIDGHVAVCYSNEEQAPKKGKEQKTTSVSNCLFCQKQFDVGLSQIDIDSHIAACMATLDEEPDRDEHGDLSNTPTFTCPHCQITFGKGYSQVDIDGHFAACSANEAESSSKKQKTTWVSTCPLCQMKFDKRLSQIDIDGHIAVCIAGGEDSGQDEEELPNPAPLSTCPLCQMQFDTSFSRVEIDGHIAACLSAADDDVTW